MNLSESIILIIGLGITCFVGVRVFNYAHQELFYRPSRTKIAGLLSRSLVHKATQGELDYFMCVSIKHDPYLERVRLNFANLYGPSAFETSIIGERSWTTTARDRVQTMIDSLREEL